MFKRVMAWILLAGFVLLLLNVAVFGIYRELSVSVYLVIMLMYVFYIIANKQ
jgi:hypothetical protein